METKNFYDITVNEICDNAMVGKGTFYNHFGSKDDLLSFLIGEYINDCINKALGETSSDNLCEYCKIFFINFTEVFEANEYNFKPIDNYTAVGIIMASFGRVYNKLMESLRNFRNEDNKFNRFTAKYIALALILLVFDLICCNNYNSDETKENISLLMDKLLA